MENISSIYVVGVYDSNHNLIKEFRAQASYGFRRLYEDARTYAISLIDRGIPCYTKETEYDQFGREIRHIGWG